MPPACTCKFNADRNDEPAVRTGLYKDRVSGWGIQLIVLSFGVYMVLGRDGAGRDGQTFSINFWGFSRLLQASGPPDSSTHPSLLR